ncbi:lipoate--protein ligase family protein [Aerococcus urinaeequi]|uniref:Lipoate--protein ligase family protein n=2 Tax=Aerococcus urinaeequi TaxID=51665 RepID=A0ABR5ZYR7_9LACT|nr:lipoate--protein ligase family protein [Aerococcus urinaeequi]MBA5829692.1 lipoate--protein ligase family protein [Aerococcus urinaeequi]MBA5860671.1 lipoate--protein ligase family protein [Aerococcus urinaeequi]
MVQYRQISGKDYHMMFDNFKTGDKPLTMAVYKDITKNNQAYSLEEADVALLPFAVDDAILNAINQETFEAPLAIHFWPTRPTVILGGLDTRLPDFNQAVTWLYEDQAILPIVRPAGGLAVVSDPNVLNLTLLMDTQNHAFTIDQAYEFIVALLQEMMDEHGLTLEVGEVATSYCPGKFDVSINGQKVAGIAQRRIGHAVGIYLYMSITGDQTSRGQLVADMYESGQAAKDERGRYPNVNPSIMANLSDFAPIDTVEKFVDDLLTVIADAGVELDKRSQEALDTATYIERMQKRNQVLYDILANQ